MRHLILIVISTSIQNRHFLHFSLSFIAPRPSNIDSFSYIFNYPIMSQVRQSQPRQATAAPANRSHQPADPAAKNTSEVLPGTIEVQRKAVIDLWNNTKNGSVKERVAKRWNEWSPAVRANFIKRAQNAVIAQIQTSLPRKQ